MSWDFVDEICSCGHYRDQHWDVEEGECNGNCSVTDLHGKCLCAKYEMKQP